MTADAPNPERSQLSQVARFGVNVIPRGLSPSFPISVGTGRRTADDNVAGLAAWNRSRRSNAQTRFSNSLPPQTNKRILKFHYP
jgi:hypothetical protein